MQLKSLLIWEVLERFHVQQIMFYGKLYFLKFQRNNKNCINMTYDLDNEAILKFTYPNDCCFFKLGIWGNFSIYKKWGTLIK